MCPRFPKRWMSCFRLVDTVAWATFGLCDTAPHGPHPRTIHAKNVLAFECSTLAPIVRGNKCSPLVVAWCLVGPHGVTVGPHRLTALKLSRKAAFAPFVGCV